MAKQYCAHRERICQVCKGCYSCEAILQMFLLKAIFVISWSSFKVSFQVFSFGIFGISRTAVTERTHLCFSYSGSLSLSKLCFLFQMTI